MTRHVVLLSAAGLVLALSACGRSPSASAPAPAPPGKSGTVAKGSGPGGAPSAPSAAEDGLQLPPPSQAQYETKGRRDPFEVPGAREGAASTTVASAKLAGIIRTAGGSALALIETSEGLGYILRQGDTLGDGQLVEIDQNSVVFSVAVRNTPTPNRVVLRLVSE
jgi:hypothetical protein